jgi:hypothetical protein
MSEWVFRRVRDLLIEMNLAEVQLQVLREQAGPHLARDMAARLGTVHRRLDRVEHQLRARAHDLGEPANLTVPELRQRLSSGDRRRQRKGAAYAGPERRVGNRRRPSFTS